MKNLLLTAVILLVSNIIHHKTMAQAKITHIAVYVEDIKRSTAFYSDVFEFEELDEPFKDGVHVWFDIGNNLSMHIIQAPWEPVTINKNNHICFSVPDMKAFIAKLESLGVTYGDWPGNEGEINIRPDGIQQIYIQDPDGYWIEINDEY
ncbi:VOC family protein [Arthrospiribacter ruber]|uniref:Glyoxalase n=1 Tax=Arthrospiribacter ruber TaxID=2487934 RepID=A0A951J0F1_9BACT|nr:VOC family protein [Arthrospiribacter ruber]MBW3470510.1 glyoxalase [Arthrospiribacter ruber]